MREIKSEIDIAASPAKVWNILTNMDHWSDWNPMVNHAAGEAAVGAKLQVTMRGTDGKDSSRYSPVVTTFDAPTSFQWRATMMAGFLFTNYKIFHLKETQSGTRLRHTEAFAGVLVPLFWGKLNQGVPPILDAMNAALKAVAEAT